jgi:hypothetical protein
MMLKNMSILYLNISKKIDDMYKNSTLFINVFTEDISVLLGLKRYRKTQSALRNMHTMP